MGVVVELPPPLVVVVVVPKPSCDPLPPRPLQKLAPTARPFSAASLPELTFRPIFSTTRIQAFLTLQSSYQMTPTCWSPLLGLDTPFAPAESGHESTRAYGEASGRAPGREREEQADARFALDEARFARQSGSLGGCDELAGRSPADWSPLGNDGRASGIGSVTVRFR